MAEFADLPVGFSLMLAQRPAAMRRFAALSPEARADVVARARSARSREAMQALADRLSRMDGP